MPLQPRSRSPGRLRRRIMPHRRAIGVVVMVGVPLLRTRRTIRLQTRRWQSRRPLLSPLPPQTILGVRTQHNPRPMPNLAPTNLGPNPTPGRQDGPHRLNRVRPRPLRKTGNLLLPPELTHGTSKDHLLARTSLVTFNRHPARLHQAGGGNPPSHLRPTILLRLSPIHGRRDGPHKLNRVRHQPLHNMGNLLPQPG